MITSNSIIEEDLEFIVSSLKDTLSQLEGKTVLITGGSGFLGKYMVNALVYANKKFLKHPVSIISVDNYITSDREEKNTIEHVKRIDHDVSKPLHLQEEIDYIIHAAGIASPIYYRRYPLETIDVAVIGTKNMLELAKEKKVKSILFFSSSEIYGDPPASEIPTKETYHGNVSSIGPRSCYDESKRLGEALCMSYKDLYNIPVKVVRPFNVYGPGMRPNDYRVIPMFVWCVLKGKELPMHSEGKQTRAFCYISDATIGFLGVLLSDKNGEVYNVGNDKTEVSIQELAQEVVAASHLEAELKNMQYPQNYPQGEPRRRCPDLTKFTWDIGISPAINLQKGLERTIEWCKNTWDLSKEY